MDAALKICDDLAVHIDVDDADAMRRLIGSAIGTKFSSRYGMQLCDMAVDAVRRVAIRGAGGVDVDIKRYAKVEKIPGGDMEDCAVLSGVMFNKDVTHSRMRRRIENPRILLLDCTLEYKKGESKVGVGVGGGCGCGVCVCVCVCAGSWRGDAPFTRPLTPARSLSRAQTDVEVTKEEDWDKLLKQEEEEIQRICADIIRFRPDVVITEKGVSDLAQHYLVKAGITAIRRLRKTDNNRVARCVGATIVHRTDEVGGTGGASAPLRARAPLTPRPARAQITEEDIGTGCGLFEVRKIGDEYFTFVEQCADPKACTILLRGASKDALNEMERNLQDAMQVARNVVLDPRLLPGGGATEMAVAAGVVRASKGIEGWVARARVNERVCDPALTRTRASAASSSGRSAPWARRWRWCRARWRRTAAPTPCAC